MLILNLLNLNPSYADADADTELRLLYVITGYADTDATSFEYRLC